MIIDSDDDDGVDAFLAPCMQPRIEAPPPPPHPVPPIRELLVPTGTTLPAQTVKRSLESLDEGIRRTSRGNSMTYGILQDYVTDYGFTKLQLSARLKGLRVKQPTTVKWLGSKLRIAWRGASCVLDVGGRSPEGTCSNWPVVRRGVSNKCFWKTKV